MTCERLDEWDTCDDDAMSIMVNPIRMHLTLGVMNLAQGIQDSASTSATPDNGTPKTVSAALELLQSLQSNLLELTKCSGVNVGLETMGAFPSRTKGRTNAGVLWVGPDDRRSSMLEEDQLDWDRLWSVCSSSVLAL